MDKVPLNVDRWIGQTIRMRMIQPIRVIYAVNSLPDGAIISGGARNIELVDLGAKPGYLKFLTKACLNATLDVTPLVLS